MGWNPRAKMQARQQRRLEAAAPQLDSSSEGAPPVGTAGSSGAAVPFRRPSQACVLAAVKSLYSDRLEPHYRILFHRIREGWASDPIQGIEDAPWIEPKVLCAVCRNCQELTVEFTGNNEFTVFLVGYAKDFVDVTSPVDPFPEEIWERAKEYFDSFSEGALVLPRGHYLCARVLLFQQLAFLKGMCLGEVCHFVWLCVHKMVLEFADGNLVPLNYSNLISTRVCNSTKDPHAGWELATWGQVRVGITSILEWQLDNNQPAVVAISSLSILFRAHFGLLLSASALGYPSVSAMLHDERLSGIYRLDSKGYLHGVG